MAYGSTVSFSPFSLQKEKRTKKGKQMEIMSNSESKTQKVQPEWPQFSQVRREQEYFANKISF